MNKDSMEPKRPLEVEHLTEAGYELLETLPHSDLIPFVQVYMKKSNIYTRFYWGANLLLAIALLSTGSFWVSKGAMTGGVCFSRAAIGFSLSFLLIPLHEYIHALAYRQQGATQTSFDAYWRKFYFMAVADRFVADARAFRVVALAPFVAISTGLLVLVFSLSPGGSVSALAALLAHTSFCSGDFGLLSYFECHRDKTVVTYDDKAQKISYFYFKLA